MRWGDSQLMKQHKPLDYCTPGAVDRKPAKRPSPRWRRCRDDLFGYAAVLFGIGFNVAGWTASIQCIAAGQFTEVGGPGGPPIGVVPAAKNPVEFWLAVVWFPLGGAIFLGYFLRHVVRRQRSRASAIQRLQQFRRGIDPPPKKTG